MFSFGRLFPRPDPGSRAPGLSERTLWLGRPQSRRSPISEQQYWMPSAGERDLVFGLVNLAPCPGELLDTAPPRVLLPVRFLEVFSALPQVTAFALGQTGLRAEAERIDCEGFHLAVRAQNAPITPEVQFGWVAAGPLAQVPSLLPRGLLHVGVMAEWEMIESLFGAPTPAGASADTVPDVSLTSGLLGVSADDTARIRSLRRLRDGARSRLGAGHP